MTVDDSTTMRTIIKNQILNLPKEYHPISKENILEAADGQEAVQLLDKNKSDWNIGNLVVFLDVNMPNMDGFETLKYIRNQDFYDDKLSIVMCTTEAEKNRVLKAAKMGADSYIVKPFTPEILLEKVMHAITRRFVDQYWRTI